MALIYRVKNNKSSFKSAVSKLKRNEYKYDDFLDDCYTNIENTIGVGDFNLYSIQYPNQKLNISENETYNIQSKEDVDDLLSSIIDGRDDINKLIIENVDNKLYISTVPMETYWFKKNT